MKAQSFYQIVAQLCRRFNIIKIFNKKVKEKQRYDFSDIGLFFSTGV